ncbi:sulfotransferase family protein [Desulfosarcina ovata]|nr:sulfotransferase [Desulfosarcina ovata]
MIKDADRPIFIVGMNGSGTTMLADCLNNHPDIYIHKVESRVIPYYAQKIDQYGDLGGEKVFRALVNEFSNNYAFRAVNHSKSLDIPYDYRSIKQPTLATAIQLTFSYFAQIEDKVRWGDHSPKYALFIPEILDLFPKAKFIHIYRDGRDCAQSFRNRFRQNIYRAIQEWKTMINKARTDGARAGDTHYHEIRYESLTNDPTRYMKAICSFLDVPYNKRVLDSRMPMFKEKNGQSSGQGQGTLVQNYGKWRKVFTPREIRKLEGIAGMTLRNMGYEILYNSGNRDLSDGQLKLLKAIDRVNASIAFFSRYKDEDRWGTFLRSIRTSLRQGRAR